MAIQQRNPGGATNATLMLTNVQLSQAGNYAVLVSNALGFVLSSNALLTVQPVSSNCVPAPAGLVAWWRGEASALDSAGTNDAVLAGATFASGQVGQAFSFDGVNGAVLVPASLSTDLSRMAGWTIEAWVNPASFNNVAWPIIYARGYWGASLGLNSGTSKLESWISNDNQLVGSIALQLGQWNHVALVYDGANRSFYVNGLYAGAGTAPGISPGPTDSAIGDVPPVDARARFAGRIDEVSIYSRALSSNEVKAIYTAGSAGKCLPGGGTTNLPTMVLSATNLDFGSVLVGQSSQLSITISNAGAATFIVSNLAASGPFSFTAPAAPFNVATNSQQSVTLVFAPASAGTNFVVAQIVCNDPNRAVVTVSLSGIGVAPVTPPGLRADYRFQNNLFSSVGNPLALTNLGNNAFVTATVDGAPRTVLAFGFNDGVLLQPGTSVIPSNVYSIVILTALDDISYYRRLLGFPATATDAGWYVHHGRLSYWPVADGASEVIADGQFVQITVTRAADGTVRGYVDGSPQIEFSDAQVRTLDRLPPLGPALVMTRAGNNVTVAWPANFTGYRLRSTPSLAPPIAWTTVTNVSVSGTVFQATVSLTNNGRFFQLVSP